PLPPPPLRPRRPPASWSAALPFWKRKPSAIGAPLRAHLRQHPYDLLAARAVLRSLAPEDEDTLHSAGLVLTDPTLETIGEPAGAATFLRVRIARGLASVSPRAAVNALGSVDGGIVADLVRRHLPRTEIDATLADLAVLGVGTRLEASL